MGMFDTVYVAESAGIDLRCQKCGAIPKTLQTRSLDNDMVHFMIMKFGPGVRIFVLEKPDEKEWWTEYTPEERAERIAKARLKNPLSIWMANNDTGQWKPGAWEPKNRRLTKFPAGMPHQHVVIYDKCNDPTCDTWNEWRLKFTDGVMVECVRVPEVAA